MTSIAVNAPRSGVASKKLDQGNGWDHVFNVCSLGWKKIVENRGEIIHNVKDVNTASQSWSSAEALINSNLMSLEWIVDLDWLQKIEISGPAHAERMECHSSAPLPWLLQGPHILC